MEEKALTVTRSFDETMSMAAVLVKSGYFQDVKDAAQAVVKVMYGAEIGIGPVASMMGIDIIKGKPALKPNLMASVLKSRGRYNYKVTRLDDTGCSITFYEGKTEIGISTFTADDAKRANLDGDNYRKFPRNMFFARAMSNGIKWYCPDTGGGASMYTPEELGETVDGETGEVIGPKWTEPVVKAGEEPGNGDGLVVTAPTEPPKRPAQVIHQTSAKPAVKTAKWRDAATKLAAEQPYYQTDGQPNFYKMLNAAAKHAGVTEITDANLPDVLAALTAHAAAEMEVKPGDVVEL